MSAILIAILITIPASLFAGYYITKKIWKMPGITTHAVAILIGFFLWIGCILTFSWLDSDAKGITSSSGPPEQQERFLEINSKYANMYTAKHGSDAQKKMAESKAVSERTEAINEFTDFANWEVKVKKVKMKEFMNKDRKSKFIVLEVVFGGRPMQFLGVTLTNSDQKILGVSDNVFKEDNPLFGIALSLNEGQIIRVSGQFMRDHKEKLFEQSITEEGGMREPEYVVFFTEIYPVK